MGGRYIDCGAFVCVVVSLNGECSTLRKWSEWGTFHTQKVCFAAVNTVVGKTLYKYEYCSSSTVACQEGESGCCGLGPELLTD